jgi:hypothetical protein
MRNIDMIWTSNWQTIPREMLELAVKAPVGEVSETTRALAQLELHDREILARRQETLDRLDRTEILPPSL